MQACEFTWDHGRGWKGLDQAPAKPDLVLFFGQREDISPSSIYSELRERFPLATISGASGGGQINSQGVVSQGITGLAIKFRQASVRLATAIISDSQSSLEAGMSLGRSLMADDLKGILVLADGIEINGDLLASGLAKVLPPHVIVGGGLAADNDRFKKTLVSGNSWPQSLLAVGIGFYGESLTVSSGIGSGWESTGKQFQITASRLNKLYDIDDRTALEIYEKHLGAEGKNLPISGLKFPLSIKNPADTGDGLVRTLLGIDRDVGMLTFAGNMPEGWNAELMHADPETLIKAAGDAARTALAQPQASILVSCIGRRLMIGQRCREEVETYLRALGTRPAVTGFYSYGGLATGSRGQGCKLYNQTLTAFSLHEHEQQAA